MADFLSTLQSFESGDARHPERGGSNIANTRQGTSSGQAQGYNQITTGTWKEFGGLAYAPTALQATQEQQNAIAAKIPLRRWAPETLAFLRNQGFTLQPNATLAENIALNHGTLGTASPPHTPTPGTAPAASAAAPAAPPNPFTAFAPGGAAAPGGAVATSLTNLDKALGGQQPGQQQQGGRALDMQASPTIPGPGAVNVSPLFNPMLGQQMMAQLSRAPARPAQQGPIGTSLNSMPMLDTGPVQFPQVYPSQMGYGGMGSMSMGGYPSSGGYGYGG